MRTRGPGAGSRRAPRVTFAETVGALQVVTALDAGDIGNLGFQKLRHHLKTERGRGREQPLLEVLSESGKVAIDSPGEAAGAGRRHGHMCEAGMWGPPLRLGGLRKPAIWPDPGGRPPLKFHGPETTSAIHPSVKM